MRWDVRKGEKAAYIEDSVVKTIAGFANSPYGGTLLVGVTDDGGIYGLEDDYATFSKRTERGDRDLWGQHLKNLLDRLGKSAAALVDWEFFTINGEDICRIDIDPSDHPVFETKSGQQVFWHRTPVSTDRIDDETERTRLIARTIPCDNMRQHATTPFGRRVCATTRSVRRLAARDPSEPRQT
jgi:predicted HTH transcriptional regulator